MTVKYYSLCILAQCVMMILLFLRLEIKVGAFLCGHKQLREFMNVELSFENYQGVP